MSAGTWIGGAVLVAAIAAAPFLGCVGDEPSTATGTDGGGDGSSSDGNAGDGSSATDGDLGDASCGPCSVACSGNKCPTAPVQITTWCSDFANATNATNDSSCVVLQSGDVYCWGYNNEGELGVGDKNVRTAATKIATDANGDPFSAVEVAMGVAHACARKADGSIWCWGSNTNGECGQLASATPILRPTRVGSLGGYKHIYAKGYFSCGIDASDQVTCWGLNDQDELGNTGGATQTPTTIAFQSSNLTTSNMSLGDQGGCAQVLDNAYCWGTDRNELLSELGTGNPSATPVDIADPSGTTFLEGVAGVERSRFTAFALLTSQEVVGWGDNDFGALGFGPGADNQKDPRYFGGDGVDAGGAVTGVVQIAAGLAHTCVRKTDGSILCAGIDSLLQQGSNSAITGSCTAADSTDFNPGASTCATTPLPLDTFAGPAVTGATFVAAGCGLTCYVGADRKVYCEGNDTFGQTGRATGTGDVACTWDGLTGPFKCGGTPAPVEGLP